jgi:dihydrofolate reductase
VSVGAIWAQAANGVIGRDGRLPWHLPEDLRLFRETTLGATVVMGRRTWDSLPAAVRPLPGRRNVVLSTRRGWEAPGAAVAGSLEAAVAGADGDVWVIGGATVYAAALQLADRLVVTELAEPFEGDVRAPEIPPGWALDGGPVAGPGTAWAESSTGLRYRILRYSRV